MHCIECGRHRGHTLGCSILAKMFTERAANEERAQLERVSKTYGVETHALAWMPHEWISALDQHPPLSAIDT